MSEEMREKIAEDVIAILPFYHRKLFRPPQGVTGMQAAQYRMLGILLREGSPLPMSELGRRMYISKPYMTVLVDQMIENGLARRMTDDRDRRIIKIDITRKGVQHLRQAAAWYKESVRETLADLDERDLEGLSTSLDTIRKIIAKIK